MKKFDFRLDKILDYRQGCRKISQEELVRRNNELFEIEQYIEALAKEQQRVATSQEQYQLNIADLFLSSMYQEKLQKELVLQKELGKKVEAQVDLARENYIEKSKEVRVLELLKDKKFDEHKIDLKRSERKRLDEIAHRQPRGV
ncbi:MAG: flagellar export protein FliJ [Deltaproteobacteria bacterium]|jgi:flagellar FliJ protein|nr:flagellar export protein FliJ [Deltaproteobacteria bacterium]